MKIFFAKWNLFVPRALRSMSAAGPAGACPCNCRGSMQNLSPTHFLTGSFQPPVPSWSWVTECTGAQHVLLCMLMVLPDQGGSLQGSPGVSQDILAVDDPGTGSGWQQSKQNWALPSVVGILGQNATQ